VAKKEPNAWGLYDVHGNVFEWVWDRGGQAGGEPAVDPLGPATGLGRGVRGGSFGFGPKDCQASYDGARYRPSRDFFGLGFRLVRTVPR